MRHGVKGRKLNRTSGERRALLSGLALSLLRFEQIQTTLPKAKELAPVAEKLITLGKKGGLANRRRFLSFLHDMSCCRKTFDVLAHRYEGRKGGYTRIVKTGHRYGDWAPMAIIELLDRDLAAKDVGELSS